MQNSLCKKVIVLWIILLFVGTSIISSNANSSEDEYLMLLTNQNRSIISTDWWNTNWNYRKQIIIDNSMVVEDLQNFPILIYHKSSNFSDHAQPDGDDFVFVDNSNTVQYNHEIDYYNDTLGELFAWVNVTSLDSSEDTLLYLYYGNSDCNSQENIVETWDANFIMVHHLSGTDSTDCDDSTSNNNDVVSDYSNPSYQQEGNIGFCVDFDGNDYLMIFDSDSLDVSHYTLEAWIYYDKTTTQYIVSKQVSIGAYSLYLVDGKEVGTQFWISGNYYCQEGYAEVGTNIWRHCVATYDGNKAKIYLDGELDSTSGTISGNIDITIDDVFIASGRYNYDLDGRISELRISNNARDSSWIKTSFLNQNEPESYINVGEEEVALIANFTYSISGLKVSFNGSSSYDFDGFIISYEWDFGDETSDTGMVVNHNYTESGTYNVTLTVTDDDGFKDNITKSIVLTNQPPNAPIINGPNSGKPEHIYSFNFIAEDPNGDDVYYEIDWGEGSIEPWDGPHTSNTVISRDHSWKEKGSFTIMARAKDEYGLIGEWGTFDVTMPKNKFFIFNFPLLNWLFERFPNAFPIFRYIIGLT